MAEKVKVKAVPCEVYSRVVGYFRPVANWNQGKQVEFAERKTVRLEKAVVRPCGCGA
jgi:anaerobic ribonucleoside-triphosphate reductase